MHTGLTRGTALITATRTDLTLNQPYTDVDEQRILTDSVSKVTVSYRYVHGGFSGTNAKFSLYFPSQPVLRAGFSNASIPPLKPKRPIPRRLPSL